MRSTLNMHVMFPGSTGSTTWKEFHDEPNQKPRKSARYAARASESGAEEGSEPERPAEQARSAGQPAKAGAERFQRRSAAAGYRHAPREGRKAAHTVSAAVSNRLPPPTILLYGEGVFLRGRTLSM